MDKHVDFSLLATHVPRLLLMQQLTQSVDKKHSDKDRDHFSSSFRTLLCILKKLKCSLN